MTSHNVKLSFLKWFNWLVFIIALAGLSKVFANEHNIDLVVSYKTVNFSGKTKKAIAVNNQIPAPTLHFKQGDHITINVHNNLDIGTAMHWHGILVPWQMDGVEGVTQKPIPPGGVFHYEFTLEQSGTYWYHAHANTQEQDGVYGAFIIDPQTPSAYKYTKEYVIVMSDWSNAKGAQVLANLKKEGDYYSSKFPLQPSLMKFIHDYRKATPEEGKKIIDDYKMMQQMRMSLYDFSDVAYDAYLMNGQPKTCPWTATVKTGDIVRLRFIGAAGSTIYRVKIPDEKMQMVHVQGNDVKSYMIDDFSIAPGETYDVLVKIEKNKPYIIYAESIDTLGKVYGALVTDQNQAIDYHKVNPFPKPEPVTRTMMSNMMKSGMHHNSMSPRMVIKKEAMHNMNMMSQESMKSMPQSHSNHSVMSNNMKMPGNIKMNHGMTMDHAMHMNMPTEPSIIGDTISSKHSSPTVTEGTKYQNLIAAVKTNDVDKPVSGTIRMELFGYMERFVWFINGLPEYNTMPILIEPGKRYRIIYTNNSMMRHPMHIHGHWFIFRKGNGAFDPLLHTIEVAPGETIVADFDADASGQWFFHCHHLYHMMTGMSRIFQYTTIIDVANGSAKPEKFIEQSAYVNRPLVREDITKPLDKSLIKHPMAHSPGLYLANFLDMGEDPFHDVQKLNFKGLYGSDYNKLQLLINDASMKKGKIEDADLDVFYWRLISQFWAIKAGVNYFYRPGEPYWQPGVGIEGLMPYFVDINIRTYYHRDSFKFDAEFSRDSQITNNLLIRAGVRGVFATKTIVKNEIGNGLNQIRYIIRPYYRIAPGVSLFLEFEHEQNYGSVKKIRRTLGKTTVEDTVTFGIAVLF
ncbi:MAG TPA: multicopper oxidase domain-containing protein [Gammaproteobacteria bacterium]|nr:multicopper oxidase domain-containing protein [Gammaproteobacteria bacterium]